MKLKEIREEFCKEYECENDVVKQCILDLVKVQNATKTLGVSIAKSKGIENIYKYLVIRLRDTAKERCAIDMWKIQEDIK